MEHVAGFEPANNGFADRSLRPLGYTRKLLSAFYKNLQALYLIPQNIFPTAQYIIPENTHTPQTFGTI